jgi:D-methionine transport system substrate-binding protein
MRLLKTLSILVLIILALGFALTGCDKKKEASDVVTVGIIDGPETKIWETVQQVALQKYALHVKLVTFSDYNMPNEALNSGEIDANAFQHMPFLVAQINDHHYDIVPIAKTFLYPISLYSKKITNISQLKDGDKIAVPNDPSNEARALLLLQQGGLITLKQGADVKATVVNIESNPKHLKIVELDAAQLPRVLPDVTAAVINNDFAVPAGLTKKEAVLVENKNSPYMNIIAVRPTEVNEKKIQELVKAYQSPEVKAEAFKLFGDNAIAGW